MKPEDAEEFTQALGLIAAGAWRQLAWAERNGVPKALGLTTREWAEQRLGGYVRLSIPERREAVAELTEDGMNTESVADVLGAHPTTVRRDKRAIAREEEPETAQVDDSDSEERANARIAQLSDDLAERVRAGDTELDEAEAVAVEREKRIEAYAGQVRDSLDLLARMVGHPIPDELTVRLNGNEQKLLRTVLGAMKKGTTGGHRVPVRA